MKDNTTVVTPATVVSEVMRMKNNGFRLVSMTCIHSDENEVEIYYHFDRELELQHLKMTHAMDVSIPSITVIFFAAVVSENEIRDQFDLFFDGLVLDFNRTLFIDEEVSVHERGIDDVVALACRTKGRSHLVACRLLLPLLVFQSHVVALLGDLAPHSVSMN